MNTIEVVKKLAAESVKNRTFANGESIGVAIPALAKADAYNHAIPIILGMNFEPGKVVRKDDFVEVAKEFFGWFNKTYPNQCSNHADHPWCKMGEAICNLELCGEQHN